MDPTDTRPSRLALTGALLEQLCTNLPDGIAILGPDGCVAYANAAAAALVRRPLDTFIGLPAFDLIHPDEVDKALSGIEFSMTFPDRTAVVPYRIAGGDGSWIDVELKAGVVPTPEGDLVVLVLRDGSPRARIADALATVAGGAPIADSARQIAHAVVARWPSSGAAVVYDSDGSTSREIVAVGLPDALVAALHDRADGPEERPAPPWLRAGATGQPVIVADDELGTLQEVAASAGFRACAAAPVLDPVGEPAVIVVWFDEPAIPRLEFGHAAIDLVELLVLALERRAHLQRLWEAARRDPLTSLPNRTGFFEALDRMLGDRTAGGVALLYLDLDGFKPVNDRYGHVVGDEVLHRVAGRIRDAVRAGDQVARIGGDEFAVIARLADADDLGGEAVALAARLIEAVGAPLELDGPTGTIGPITVGASIGIALALGDGRDRADSGILERADAAMYEAKAGGRGRWRLAGDAA